MEEKFIYEFPIEIDLAKVGGKEENFLKSFNSTLSKYGIADRITCQTSFGTVNVTASHNLSQEELEKMKNIIQEQMNEKFSDLEVIIKSPRRKSCNVQQLVK